MFEAVFIGRARTQRAALSDEERDIIDALIAELEHDPSLDNILKVRFLMAPLVLSAYNAPRWRIVYRVACGHFLKVISIDRR